MLSAKNFANFALYGLAAFGAFKAFEASPLKLDFSGANRGRRGSLQEAMMWEMGGHPSQTRMMPGRRNSRR